MGGLRQGEGGLRQTGVGLRLSIVGVRYGGELRQDEVGLKLRGGELKLVSRLTVFSSADERKLEGVVRHRGGLRLGGEGVKQGGERLRRGGVGQGTGGVTSAVSCGLSIS